jgi:hypothetical protein
MLGDPLHQVPAIGPIDPDQAELFTGPAQLRKEEACPCGVRHRGGGDDHGQEQAQGIDQEVPFASFDLFPTVVATLSAQLRRLDALAVETARRGVFMTPRLLADLGAEGVVEALPVPAVSPLAEVPVHTGPLRVLMGEHAPFDAPVDDIKHGIDHRAHLQFAVAPPGLGGGIKYLIQSHSASVRSVGYGLAFIPRVY